jgi:hypothetical protein
MCHDQLQIHQEEVFLETIKGSDFTNTIGKLLGKVYRPQFGLCVVYPEIKMKDNI